MIRFVYSIPPTDSEQYSQRKRFVRLLIPRRSFAKFNSALYETVPLSTMYMLWKGWIHMSLVPSKILVVIPDWWGTGAVAVRFFFASQRQISRRSHEAIVGQILQKVDFQEGKFPPNHDNALHKALTATTTTAGKKPAALLHNSSQDVAGQAL